LPNPQPGGRIREREREYIAYGNPKGKGQSARLAGGVFTCPHASAGEFLEPIKKAPPSSRQDTSPVTSAKRCHAYETLSRLRTRGVSRIGDTVTPG